jgi:hypothetical protein
MHYSVDRFYAFLNFTRFYFIKDIAIRIGLQNMIYHISCKFDVRSSKKPSLDPITEKMLRKLFLEDIANLEKLIGRDLSSWKKSIQGGKKAYG